MASTLPRSIGGRAKTCRKLLASCAKTITGYQGHDAATVQKEFKRGSDSFNHWVSELGPLEDVHASLGFRVRELPDVADLFYRHLDILECRIEQVYHCCVLDHAGSPPDNWELSELLESIQESVGWLSKLSTFVQNESIVHKIACTIDTPIRYDGRPPVGSLPTDKTTNASALWCVPLFENKRFVGREDTLGELKKKFFEDRFRQVAVVGLGGMGKTQVALRLAYWVRANRPEYSIFWLSALSFPSFEQTYGDVARHLPIRQGSGDDPKDLAKQYLSSPAAGPWLLIVDNADDDDLLFGSSTRISKHFPVSESGLVLFTTRSGDIARQATKAANRIIQLNEMKQDEALNFLDNLVERRVLDERSIAVELLEELNHLPLAIAQAAAYLNRNKISTKEYLEIFRGAEHDKIDLMTTEYADDNRYQDQGSTNAIATALLISFNQIYESDLGAAHLLSFISQIEPKAIPGSILPEVQSKNRKLQALGTLLSYSLLNKRGDDDMYDMHSLVHFMASIWVRMRSLNERFKSEDLLTTHLADVLPRPQHKNRVLWRAYLPHAIRLLHNQKQAGKILERSLHLRCIVGSCLYEDVRFEEAIACLEIYTREAQKFLPEDDWQWLNTQHTLALAYQDNGQTAQAIDLLEHVVEIRKALAEDHPNRLSSQRDLAMAYRDNGQITQAINLLEHVVEIQKALTEDHPNRLTSQHALAIAYRDNGQTAQAIDLLEHIVEIRKTLAEDHPNRLTSQHALALAYRDNSQTAQAIDLLEHVVEIRKALAEDHPNRLTSQHTLALAYQDNGQTAQAIDLLEHVVEIRKALAEDHPNRLSSEKWLKYIKRSIKETDLNDSRRTRDLNNSVMKRLWRGVSGKKN